MLDVPLYRASIPFALATGTGAGLLAVLSWDVLRGSPFGTPLKLLALVMSTVAVYHGGLLVAGTETVALQSLLILGYVLVSIALVVAMVELNGNGWGSKVVRHRNVFLATVLGLVLYAIGGPLSEVFFPPLLHWVHGFAALFAIAGLYSPVHDDLRNRPWTEFLLEDVTDGRSHADWMVPMDDAILDILYASRLTLTPAVIAYNIDRSREAVNRRLSKLESAGLVERVERGKYRLADPGERFVEGDIPGPA
jgi:DNA-binding transcriptional ArsR family regulator